MIKQTAGVNSSAAGLWSPSAEAVTTLMSPPYKGVSTCLWRGVHVRDVLLACGLQDQPDTERWFVNFEGKCSRLS